MVGPVSELKIGPIAARGNYLLVLDIAPFVRPPALPAQNLTISIGGVPFVQTALTRGGKFGYRIPSELLAAGGEPVLVFDHPDAARPSDVSDLRDPRPLAISFSRMELFEIEGAVGDGVVVGKGGLPLGDIQPRVGLSPAEFAAGFESLGENCEFGLVQRRCGAEPLSLLRFSNTLLPNLLRGLQVGFHGLGEPQDLQFHLEGKWRPEYIIEEKRYGLIYHTFRYKGEIDEDKFVASESARLKFLVRKFVEDLLSGEKILVCKRNTPLLEEEILALLGAVMTYGENTLLWVVQADQSHPPGSAHWVMPGLIKGYIDQFAPNENAHDLSLEVWLELCVNTWELWRSR